LKSVFLVPGAGFGPLIHGEISRKFPLFSVSEQFGVFLPFPLTVVKDAFCYFSYFVLEGYCEVDFVMKTMLSKGLLRLSLAFGC